MLLSALLCFIDQRLASFLYHHFRDNLQIHKRCIGNFFFTTIIVVIQIIFDKNFSFTKKSQTSFNQTEMTNIESKFSSNTEPLPSFNLHSAQISTPKFPVQKKVNNNTRPTPNIRFDTSEIEIHREDDITTPVSNKQSFYTARETSI
jgi:hypothetical protein